MKILSVLSLLTIFLQTLSFGQQLPNSGFENWEITTGSQKDKANSWNTINSTVPSAVALLLSQTSFKTTSPHSGTQCIKLKTVSPPSFPPGTPIVNGLATTGTINTTSYNIEGGLPFSHRPDSLVGWFKCSPQTGDFGTIEFVLKNSGIDTIGHARFETPSSAISSWTRFSAPIIYRNSNTPAQAVALLSSSDGYNPVVGSELFVDDLELMYNPINVDEIQLTFDSYFSNNRIVIESELQQFEVEIINIMGKSIALLENKRFIDFYEKPGVYLVKFSSKGKSGVKKIVVN